MAETSLVFKGSSGQTLTSSLLVARKFEKEHDKVLRDIRNLAEGVAKIGETPMFVETTYVNEQNRQSYPMFVMNRDGFTLLAMGFTGEKALKFKIEYIAAFNEMEKTIRSGSPQVPQTFSEALMLAAKQQQKIEQQQRTIEASRPKVEFFDAVADSKTAIKIGDLAKVLAVKGLGRNNLFELLRNKKILMENNIPYQTYVDRGYFRTVEQKYTAGDEVRISIRTLVYQKGVDFIRKLIQT